MHEIVIVRNVYYEPGSEVHSKPLIENSQQSKRLWWFNGPFTTKDLRLVLRPHPTEERIALMSCEAIWFEFEFVPDLREYEHFQPGSSYMAEEFEHGRDFDLFEEDLPQFVEIIRRKLKECDCPVVYADTDFYALYEVRVYPEHDSDGEYCGIEVESILLGELDMSKLVNALVAPKGTE